MNTTRTLDWLSFIGLLVFFGVVLFAFYLFNKRDQRPKSTRELIQDSLFAASDRVRITYDSSQYYAIRHQQATILLDSLADRIFRRDPSLDPFRDSLRSVIQRRIREGARGQPDYFRAIEADPPQP